MADDDESARIARANELRKRIAGLKGESGEAQPPDGASGLSPRDFVHERMIELERDEHQDR